MASGTKTAQSAILSRFQTQWADRTPVAYPNVDFTPPDDEPWVRLDIVWGEASPATMGATRRNTLPGVIFINVFHAPGEARGAAHALIDAARDIFNRVEFSGVRCDVPSGPEPVRGGDKQWDQVVTRVAFTVDELA